MKGFDHRREMDLKNPKEIRRDIKSGKSQIDRIHFPMENRWI